MQFTPTQQRWLAWIALAGAACLLLGWLGPVLMPFMVAALLAYALTPLVRALDRLFGAWVPRLITVSLVELLFLLTMTALGLLLVPVLSVTDRLKVSLVLVVAALMAALLGT